MRKSRFRQIKPDPRFLAADVVREPQMLTTKLDTSTDLLIRRGLMSQAEAEAIKKALSADPQEAARRLKETTERLAAMHDASPVIKFIATNVGALTTSAEPNYSASTATEVGGAIGAVAGAVIGGIIGKGVPSAILGASIGAQVGEAIASSLEGGDGPAEGGDGEDPGDGEQGEGGDEGGEDSGGGGA